MTARSLRVLVLASLASITLLSACAQLPTSPTPRHARVHFDGTSKDTVRLDGYTLPHI